MGAWGYNSFSNDETFDFLQLPVIPYRVMGGVDDLEVTEDILNDIIKDIDNCDEAEIKMAAIIFLVYKGCTVDAKYIDWALEQAEGEYNSIKSDVTNKRSIKLGEEIDNLKKAKMCGKIDELHIPSIMDSATEKGILQNN